MSTMTLLGWVACGMLVLLGLIAGVAGLRRSPAVPAAQPATAQRAVSEAMPAAEEQR
jgi:hypothetical protein